MLILLVHIRNKFFELCYKILLRPVLFRIDPEKVHDAFIGIGEYIGRYSFFRKILRLCFGYFHKSLEQNYFGIIFKNPIGLAAGFDKNGNIVNILGEIGFGYAEVGSITAMPCEGNPRPRLWRIPEKKSIRVNYGLKNDGVKAVGYRLVHSRLDIPLGVSIAKTNSESTVSTQEGIDDYAYSLQFLQKNDIGDYYTINVSCPNTYGGKPFEDPERLHKLLTQLQSIKGDRPVFLKFSPNMEQSTLDEILDVCKNFHIAGYICTNLHKEKGKEESEKGGLSGKAVEQLSNDLISYIYKREHGRAFIIGLGGIFSAEDAYEKIRCGASLVQLITGMIYGGPQTVSEINRGLVGLLKKDGYKNISEAIGSHHKI
ncbi:MAG: dihydroorotate dehydrogenase (quinone) [Candidatus Magasanikbacteria bacterium CG11_big_fil_rev_8_21_14_0_20_39_34]|uniref:Dihydroorotate dehydrogenase (quinone) n=1 Tax=Candidatus Magasanikbacteria bacterium CG11_big_fil_rev_8_21_14_0_20_39_34 TaxID=1974653 RepID=A0A2H0N684_9BACT|nr:MAG: dihydroorotate dehydrogenase (quinone) [Candidatus Magasanikbacteria bacterium CG11_big_fil_rev_8_21_14_0_20_39_34]